MSALSARSFWLAPLALAVLAFGVRATGSGEVFVGDEVLPVGGEAWYHLRRQLFGLLHAPATLAFDAYLHFEAGAVAPLAPGFDALLGWLAALVPGATEAARVECVAAWSPVVFGALAVFAVAGALAPRFGRGGALVGAALLATGPAHALATRVGYVNHRAAGSLAIALLLACAVRALRGAPEGRTSATPEDRTSAATRGAVVGAVGAFGFWISMLAWWPLVLVLAALFVQAATRDDRKQALLGLACAAVASWIALVATLPFAWALPHATSDPLSLAHPSRFHVAVLAGFAAWAQVVVLAWRHRSCATRGRRLAVLLGAGVLLDLATLALVPGLGEALGRLFTLPANAAALHAAALEPALSALGVAGVFAALGAVGVALPLLGVATLALEWRAAGRVELALFVGIGGLLVMGAWSAPGGHAGAGLAIALVGGACAGALLRRAPGPAAGIALAAAVLAGAAPTVPGLRAATASDATLPLGGGRIDRGVALDVADWLREHGRPGGDWLEAEEPPAYSVVAPWELGHMLLYRGQRAPIVDGFSGALAADRLAELDAFYREPAFRSRARLDEWQVKYVVVPDVAGFVPGEVSRGSLLSSLVDYDGSETASPQPGDPFPVTHLRLVYEHGQREDGGGLRVYERVPGVRVTGASMPKRTIRFSLPLRTHTGREFTYRLTVETESEWGRYRTLLPYSTLETRRQRFVEPLGSWRVECRDEVRTLDVPDWKIRDGKAIAGPGFCY